jgi:hypothetical protein
VHGLLFIDWTFPFLIALDARTVIVGGSVQESAEFVARPIDEV